MQGHNLKSLLSLTQVLLSAFAQALGQGGLGHSRASPCERSQPSQRDEGAARPPCTYSPPILQPWMGRAAGGRP